ncbi:MAG: ankyrin repeat domain-containing protein [Alphaproteobacteria bacterium]|nr:ankyrin repeat domain-containing protein [Alphaproteobacteria bacterium]
MPTDLCSIAPLRADVTTSEQMQLFAAVSTGCIRTAAQLVAAAVPVNMGDEEDDTPLTLAIARGHAEMVDFLIAAGADVNLAGLGGKSPLRVAIDTVAPLALVKKLLKAGADPLASSYHASQKKDVSDQMAADLAYIGSRTGDENADTVLFEVTRATTVFNIIEIVKDGSRQKLNDWLRDHKVDINTYNRHGATALLHACQMGRMDLVEILWHAGADPSKPHKYDKTLTPLAMAQESDNPHVTREINRYIILAEQEFIKNATQLEKDMPVMKPAQIKQRFPKN